MILGTSVADTECLNKHQDFGIDKKLRPRKKWDVIIHPYTNFHGVVVNHDYTSLEITDEITYLHFS